MSVATSTADTQEEKYCNNNQENNSPLEIDNTNHNTKPNQKNTHPHPKKKGNFFFKILFHFYSTTTLLNSYSTTTCELSEK
jgi:hypothetical protein